LFKQTRTAKGFAILSIFFFLFIIPVERLASRESDLVGHVEGLARYSIAKSK